MSRKEGMRMPLYEVHKTYYVFADDKSEAEYHVPCDIAACDTEIIEIKDKSQVLSTWRVAIPFGRYPTMYGDDKTCLDLAGK